MNLHRIPFENKSQARNDLIREFSMQVHHQQFFISAKGYFNVNVGLVSSVSSFMIPSEWNSIIWS